MRDKDYLITRSLAPDHWIEEAMKQHKEHVVTFKVDHSLAEQLQQIPNRSEFIRTAVRRALEHNCPLCKGAGVLTPEQLSHWNEFLVDHELEECHECNALHLVCRSSLPTDVH